jgi:hypothetical protein
MNLNRLFHLAALVAAVALIAGTPAMRLVCPSAFAADPTVETLNNAAVIEMQGLNLGDAVILDKIRTSKTDFDVTVAALKQLKEAKVSDAVIQAMINAKSPAPAAPALTTSENKPAVAGDQNDPAVQHEPGVWLYEETDGVKKMTPLVTESYRLWMGAGPFGGAQHAVLSGLSAKIQVKARQPVFYMYFGEAGRSDSSIMGTTSPNQMPLAVLDLKAKTQERLLVIGTAAPFAGYNSGIRPKSLREIDVVKIADGIYKVSPKNELADGEYAFCYYASDIRVSTAGRMFCFGVHLK